MHQHAGHIWYGVSASGSQGPGTTRYDVAIIGAGVVGCALAYVLSRYRLRIIVIDKNHDVGEGTSKANSAIIHTGFDATPGTLESELVTSASRRWPELARKLKIPFLPTGALLTAITDEQASELPRLHERALANGVDDVALMDAQEALALEPHVTREVRGALLIPRESVIDPFTASIAYAEVAMANGVDFLLGTAVRALVDSEAPVKRLAFEGDSGSAEVQARIVVNAAGLGSRRLAHSYGCEPFDINPRRGQFMIYDRHARALVSRILLPIPTKHSKGMLVAPTIFGNLLAGPTAEDLPPDAVDATGTTIDGLRQVEANAHALCPALREQPVIATYAGLRCNCSQGSYWIRYNDGHAGVVTVSGIRSTGLTASITLAEYLAQGLARECGLVLEEDPAAVDSRPDSAWPGWWQRPYEDAARVRQRPEYGAIVCVCEQVSRGELADALASPLEPHTLDALKRRTRVLTGRCQGFQCGAPVARMVQEHCGIPLHQVTKRGPGTEIAAGTAAGAVTAVEIPARMQLAAGSRLGRAAGFEMASTRTHYRVAIIGAGPAGIGVALGLATRGIEPVLLLERGHEPGGVPARYAAPTPPKHEGVPTFVLWTRGRIVFGRQYAEELAERLRATSTELWLESQVVEMSRADKALTVVRPGLGKVRITADAIVMACGAREQSLAERGWIAGPRLARVMPTMQLLELLDRDGVLPMTRPVILGSDLIGYSAAAKLAAQGAGDAVMIDHRWRPGTGVLGRRYFRRWVRPDWRGGTAAVTIAGDGAPTEIWLPSGASAACDGVVVSGELTPNSELAVEAGLDVDMPGRQPILHRGVRMSEPGFFAAGNIIGGFHGAQWCYFHGKKAARAVAQYLERVQHARAALPAVGSTP